MTTGGDLVLGPKLRAQREALEPSAERFARMARISRRALGYAEQDDRPRAGKTVQTKIAATMARLAAGEVVEVEQHILRLELRPGVFVTVDADNAATLGDLREVEARIRRLIESDSV